MIVATAAFSGCGDGTGGNANGPTTSSSRPVGVRGGNLAGYIRGAEPICERSQREIRRLGKLLPKASASSSTLQETVAYGFVKPGIQILEREAAELRRIKPVPASSALATYLGLFAPTIELSHQLLAALEAGDGRRSRGLELLIAELGNEQSAAAQAVGFHSCSIGFTAALGGTR